jgi:hypothetical protein
MTKWWIANKLVNLTFICFLLISQYSNYILWEQTLHLVRYIKVALQNKQTSTSKRTKHFTLWQATSFLSINVLGFTRPRSGALRCLCCGFPAQQLACPDHSLRGSRPVFTSTYSVAEKQRERRKRGPTSVLQMYVLFKRDISYSCSY